MCHFWPYSQASSSPGQRRSDVEKDDTPSRPAPQPGAKCSSSSWAGVTPRQTATGAVPLTLPHWSVHLSVCGRSMFATGSYFQEVAQCPSHRGNRLPPRTLSQFNQLSHHNMSYGKGDHTSAWVLVSTWCQSWEAEDSSQHFSPPQSPRTHAHGKNTPTPHGYQWCRKSRLKGMNVCCDGCLGTGKYGEEEKCAKESSGKEPSQNRDISRPREKTGGGQHPLQHNFTNVRRFKD
ncbi:uncharacterized protein LOC125706620 isoform X2 [Brienomyrus brachyistius]|uniref:uncharacterized protein LOC125706620 isoform X2 n=1 Tax=Brienomyrus brachyistius TaxID=42636 RepID=UPI0020B22A03|nr:uncharacterized protein LOC125706620 isoform X2 [Brienomyrus brachyistius]